MKGRGYLHVEPSQKSRSHLREKLGELLNHWTLGRSIQETVEAVNRVLRGWAGYFHCGNSVTVMNRMKHYSQNRFRRWLWRKHACRRSLWTHYPTEQLHARYGLYELPTTAKWKAARCMSSESRIWENRPFGSMRGGRESVIGLAPFNPTSPAYSTQSNRSNQK